MFFILILFALSLRVSAPSLDASLQPASESMNRFCQSLIPSEMKHSSLLKSLICGNALENLELKEALKSSHLIHLVIISAGHFLWLEKLLLWIRIQTLFRFILFLIYGFTTLLQPPAFRFLVQRGFDEALTPIQMHLKTHQKTFLSAIVCILIFPNWVSSVSFLLSWGCALSLQASAFLSPKTSNAFQNLFIQQLYFFLFLSPWMIQLGNWHPLQILSQFFLAPFFMLILFPLGIFSLALPWLRVFFDSLVDLILPILQTFQKIQSPTESPRIPIFYFWIYLLGMHFILHFVTVFQKRQQT